MTPTRLPGDDTQGTSVPYERPYGEDDDSYERGVPYPRPY